MLTYEITSIEGQIVREIFIITYDDRPVTTPDSVPIWFFRRKDAQQWIDDRMALASR